MISRSALSLTIPYCSSLGSQTLPWSHSFLSTPSEWIFVPINETGRFDLFQSQGSAQFRGNYSTFRTGVIKQRFESKRIFHFFSPFWFKPEQFGLFLALKCVNISYNFQKISLHFQTSISDLFSILSAQKREKWKYRVSSKLYVIFIRSLCPVAYN